MAKFKDYNDGFGGFESVRDDRPRPHPAIVPEPIEYGPGRIYPTANGYAISYRRQWMPGLYESELAARLAVDLVAGRHGIDGLEAEAKLKTLWADCCPELLSAEVLRKLIK